LQLCESYRNEQGKPTNRVLFSFGAIDDLKESGQLAKLAEKFNELSQKNTKKEDLKEIERTIWGADLILQKLWSDFKLKEFFSKLQGSKQYDLNNLILKLVSDRFLKPKTKRQFFLKQKEFKLEQIYRSLDALAKDTVPLKQHLFKYSNASVDLVFFDATTLYFHSDKEDDLRKFGFSKDCKFKDVQVTLGLLMDQEGRPISYETFPGNTFDGNTLLKALDSLKRDFKIKKLILIGDRGICSKTNLRRIEELGYEYIVATSIRKLPKELKEKVLSINHYEDLAENLKYLEIPLPDSRLISTWSEKRARKDFYDRERLIEKAKEVLEGDLKLRKPGKAKYLKVHEDVESLDELKILEDEQWDGFYAIKTNNHNLSREEIYSAYRQLWRIEDCFRVLKSHLKIRPVFHWNQTRIEGHIALCFLTFLLERYLEIKLKENELSLSPEKLRETLYSMQASIIDFNGEQVTIHAPLSPDAEKLLKIMKLKNLLNLVCSGTPLSTNPQ